MRINTRFLRVPVIFRTFSSFMRKPFEIFRSVFFLGKLEVCSKSDVLFINLVKCFFSHKKIGRMTGLPLENPLNSGEEKNLVFWMVSPKKF